jgi:hypothetical protein
MKFSAVTLILFAGYASAGKPELSITLSDGSYGDIKSAVQPVVTLSGEGDGIEYGASVDLASDSMPKSVWGKTSASSGGWNLNTRAELSQGMYDFDGADSGVYVALEANDDDEKTFLWASAAVSAGDGVQGLRAGAKKVVDTDAGKFMVSPRYDFEDSSTAIVLGYEKDDTNAYVTSSEGKTDLLVKQKIDDTYSTSLKVGNAGFITGTLTKQGDSGSTKVTVTSDELDLEIESDGWVAGVSCDKNLANAKPSVRFSKSLSFGM